MLFTKWLIMYNCMMDFYYYASKIQLITKKVNRKIIADLKTIFFCEIAFGIKINTNV